MKKFTKHLLLLATAMLLSIGVYAQGRGNLSGYVKDESGSILPGAAVFLKGTTLGTSTDLNGAYTLQGVPAGEVEISITYLGYDTKTVKVKVNAGGTQSFNIVMSQLAKSIEGVTVTAAIDGQQRALNQQKVADNLMQVLSADQIGLFPDLNVTDALKRVSGVTSDGSKVSLRGTPSNFTNIMINGEQLIGTSEGGYRSPSLTSISSDVLSSMEIEKTILPSNDGDAIGGIINLRSGEARSTKAKFSVDLGTGVNFLRDKMAYNGKISYAQRFHKTDKNPNGTFGVSAKYSYYDSHSGYDRIEATAWLPYSLSTVNGSKSDKILQNPDKPYQNDPALADYNPYKEYYLPTDFRYRYQTSHSVRQGANLVLDWAPSLNTKFVLTGGYNNDKNEATRYRNRFRFRERDAFWSMEGMDAAQFPSATYGDVAIPEGGFGPNAVGGARVQNIVQHTDYTEATSNYNVNLRGETVVGSWKVDGSVGYSGSKTEYRSTSSSFKTPEYRGNAASAGTGNPAWKPAKTSIIAYIPDISTPYLTMQYLMKPQGQTAAMSADALDRYSLYMIENWDYNTEGNNLTAQLNSSYSHYVGKNASTFSFGVKGKFMGTEGFVPDGMSKVYGEYSLPSNALAPDALALKNMLYKDVLDNKFLGDHLVFGYAPDGDKIKKAFATQQVRDLLPYNSETTERTNEAYYFDTYEKVFAAYAMEKVQFKKLMVLAGVRMEYNNAQYKANQIFEYDSRYPNAPGGQMPVADRDEEWAPTYDAYTSTPKDSTINYTMVLPNVQFKYDINRNTILRLAYTTGYARPNAIDLVPKQSANKNANYVTLGNPNLKPAYAHNLDLLAEHYLSNVGIISGGVFFKNINKFQYLSQTGIDASSPYFGSEMNMIRQTKNGEKATIYGVEVTLNSTLTFLPGFLKNLVFTGNYTYVHSSANVARVDESGESAAYTMDKIKLPGQADHTANIALAYSNKRFSIQAAYNFMGSQILTLGPDKSQDVWLDGRWQLDLNGSVNIYKGLSFWVEAQNILNEDKFEYFGDRSRVYNMRIEGAVARCGFTYKF